MKRHTREETRAAAEEGFCSVNAKESLEGAWRAGFCCVEHMKSPTTHPIRRHWKCYKLARADQFRRKEHYMVERQREEEQHKLIITIL